MTVSKIISWQKTPYSLQKRNLFFIFLLCTTFFYAARYAQANLPPTQKPYTINNKSYYPLLSAEGYQQQGTASWYGPQFHGRPTSNGEAFNMHAMTAAHKILPMNTLLRVKNLENGRETVVRVNDRGPFVDGRIIDLSYAAAKSLKMVAPGTARVKISAVSGLFPKRTQQTARKEQNKRYYVQIGAFSQPDNALRIQQYFREAGYTAIIRPARLKKKSPPSLHLVQVYVGRNYHHAQKAEKILLQKGYNGAFLVAYQQDRTTSQTDIVNGDFPAVP